MSKRTRQYIGILAALAAYYLVHEGAHLLYALFAGVFKQIRLMGLGVQIDVYAEHMTNMQLGVGALATFCVGYLLTALAKNICCAQSKLLRAMLYYITIAFLLLDPLYLSGVWLTAPCSEILTAIIAVFLIRKQTGKRKCSELNG